jgi:hypothetical protein
MKKEIDLEEEAYAIIDLLKEEETKKLRTQASKLLLKISQAIDSLHVGLKGKVTLSKASSGVYIELYRTIIQVDSLLELQGALREALDVQGKTEERIAVTKRKLPMRLSGGRYKPPKKKEAKQLEVQCDLFDNISFNTVQTKLL